MVQNPSWKTDRFSASQEIPPQFMKPECSSPHSQEPAACRYPELPNEQSNWETLWKVSQYRKFWQCGLVSKSPNLQAEGPPTVGYPRLLSIFAATLHIRRRSSTRDVRTRRLLVTWAHLSRSCKVQRQSQFSPPTTVEPDRPRHDRTAACVIAQQSSSTFVSLYFSNLHVKIRPSFWKYCFSSLTL